MPTMAKQPEANHFTTTWQAVRYFLGTLFVYAPWATLLVCLRTLLAGLAAPLVVWAIQGLVTTLSHPSVTWLNIWPWLAVLFVGLMLRGAEGAFDAYSTAVGKEKLSEKLHELVWRKASQMPLVAFEQPEFYQKLELCYRGLNDSLFYAFRYCMVALAAFIGIGGIALLLARLSWFMAAIVLF